jgi:hypothetical protein
MTTTPDVAAAVHELGIADDTYGPTLNTHLDPAALEVVGRGLAEGLRPYAPRQIGVWHSADDAVLAHVVARELGATVVRSFALEGVVGLHPSVRPGTRVAFLATAWEPAQLNTLLALATTHRIEVAAVGAVLLTPALREVASVPTASLITDSAGLLDGAR